MTFNQFLLVVQARRKLILMTLIAIVLLTVAISLVLPKTYKSTATLVMNYRGIDTVTGQSLSAQLVPGYMATQVDIINSKRVAKEVVDALKLANEDEAKKDFYADTKGEGDIRDWLGDQLLKKLDVKPSRDSGVLDITFKGRTPQFAAAVANAFAAQYQQTAIQLKAEPPRRASTYFSEQIKVLRENLEKAQSKLSRYQQEKGIVGADNRIDIETSRLNDLSVQLAQVQNQLVEASSRKQQAQGKNASDSPDIAANPLIQNLRASLAQAEVRFAQVSQRLEQNHPQYQVARAEVNKLRSELEANIDSVAHSIGSSVRILQQRESDLRAAMEAQKRKVLELNHARDELAVLARDVESAQRIYDASLQRFNQTSIEGQANQTDISILNPAVPPTEVSSPKLGLNVLFSIFIGLMLGLGLALLAELRDRRVRSEFDIVETLQIPVLGVIQLVAPKKKRLRLMLPAFFSQ